MLPEYLQLLRRTLVFTLWLVPCWCMAEVPSRAPIGGMLTGEEALPEKPDDTRVPLSPAMSWNVEVGYDAAFNQETKNRAWLAAYYYPAPGWFLNGTFYRYSAPTELDPDFAYSFGYDGPVYSLTYENFTNNRFNPDRELNQQRTYFWEGLWSVGRNFFTGDEDEFNPWAVRVNYNFNPQYFDNESDKLKRNKQSLSLFVTYTIYSFWYVSATAYYYPQRHAQQPFDPDYSYGFGYYDPRPGRLSIYYVNKSGNRYSEREEAPNTGRFRDGTLIASVLFAW